MIRRLYETEENAFGLLHINLLYTGGLGVVVLTLEHDGGKRSACVYEYPDTDEDDKETSRARNNSVTWFYDTIRYCLDEIVSPLSHSTGWDVPKVIDEFMSRFRGGRLDFDKWETVGGRLGDEEWQTEGRLF